MQLTVAVLSRRANLGPALHWARTYCIHLVSYLRSYSISMRRTIRVPRLILAGSPARAWRVAARSSRCHHLHTLRLQLLANARFDASWILVLARAHIVCGPGQPT